MSKSKMRLSPRTSNSVDTSGNLQNFMKRRTFIFLNVSKNGSTSKGFSVANKCP